MKIVHENMGKLFKTVENRNLAEVRYAWEHDKNSAIEKGKFGITEMTIQYFF